MSNSFPGMDPYLEGPQRWPGVHQGMITYIRDELNPQIAPRYVAVIGERMLVESARPVYPDLTVLRETSSRPYHASGAGVIEHDPPFVVEAPFFPRESFIEIVDPAKQNRVVTVLELLSPANKSQGTDARRQYCQKQEEVLAGGANLVEIDLLRQGLPTVAAVRLFTPSLPPHDYLISISRATHRGQYETYPLTLRHKLPRMIVPISPEDRDAVVDLQAVFNRCHENGFYEALVDYGAQASVPLTPDDAAWAGEMLRQQGFRRSEDER